MSTFPFCLLLRIHLLFLSICLLALLPMSKYGCFHVTAVRCFCFLWFEKVVSFIFPSFPQSTHCSACLDFGTKSWVPFSSFPCPSLFWWRCYSHPQSPLHSSVHFGRTRNLGPPQLSLCLSLRQKRRRCLGRDRCQCCFLLVFRFRSSLGFLFFLNVAFLIFMLLAIFFFVLSSCLYNGSKHLPFCSWYQSFVFVCQGPCSAREAQCKREHHI